MPDDLLDRSAVEWKALEMTRQIRVLLTKDGDGGYSASVPRLPGVHAQGDSVEEVLSDIRQSLKATIQAYHELGEEIPWLPAASIDSPDAESMERWILSDLRDERSAAVVFAATEPPALGATAGTPGLNDSEFPNSCLGAEHATYTKIADGTCARTVEVGCNGFVDVDAEGRVLGVETLAWRPERLSFPCHQCGREAVANLGGVWCCRPCAGLQPSFLRRCLAALFVLSVLCCGCVRTTPPVAPDATLRAAGEAYIAILAQSYETAAERLESGQTTTDTDDRAFREESRKAALRAAFTPLADREQEALGDGRWTPEAAASLYRTIAREARR